MFMEKSADNIKHFCIDIVTLFYFISEILWWNGHIIICISCFFAHIYTVSPFHWWQGPYFLIIKRGKCLSHCVGTWYRDSESNVSTASHCVGTWYRDLDSNVSTASHCVGTWYRDLESNVSTASHCVGTWYRDLESNVSTASHCVGTLQWIFVIYVNL